MQRLFGRAQRARWMPPCTALMNWRASHQRRRRGTAMRRTRSAATEMRWTDERGRAAVMLLAIEVATATSSMSRLSDAGTKERMASTETR